MNQNRPFQNLVYLFVIVYSVYHLFVKPDTSAKALLKLDTDFSTLCFEKGLQTALRQFADDSVVFLPSNHYPIISTSAKPFYERRGATLRWVPKRAEVAESGELAYTYGNWTVTAKDMTVTGSYVTVWRKKEGGSWKFVLNAGQNDLNLK